MLYFWHMGQGDSNLETKEHSIRKKEKMCCFLFSLKKRYGVIITLRVYWLELFVSDVVHKPLVYILIYLSFDFFLYFVQKNYFYQIFILSVGCKLYKFTDFVTLKKRVHAQKGKGKSCHIHCWKQLLSSICVNHKLYNIYF